MKKANLANPIDKIIIINPNCLNVDKAIIFFKSNSKFAAIPAINIVNPATNKRTCPLKELKNKTLNRINKYTPAVTKVEEWTSAETGVGAAIAAGNQEEKGIWALLLLLLKLLKQK